MEEIVKLSCYVEEYSNQAGRLNARLRDKKTDKIVTITGQKVSKRHFLNFISQAKIHQSIMPTIFEKDGSDVVIVSGTLYKTTPEEIVIIIDDDLGGYWFE